jgi:hypothetical protein
MEYTTTDISAALSIAGVQFKSGGSKRVSTVIKGLAQNPAVPWHVCRHLA